jgi:hypothetical protein
MAALSDTARKKLWALFMSKGHCPGAISKTALRAAVDDLDDWVEAQALTINAALPQPFRAAATSDQKAILLAYICLQRAGVL